MARPQGKAAGKGLQGLTVKRSEVVALAQLRPYPRNPRAGDIEMIQESVRAHGQYRPLVVNERTMQVLAGNHLLHALLEEGYEKGLVAFVDVDEEEAARIVLVDNRTSDVARYEDGLLADLLTSLPGLEGTGYDEKALADLLEKVGRASELEDPDALPEPPVDPVSKPGDIWLMGPHRLMVGDSTVPAQVAQLMDGKPADMVFTDPPYAIYGSSTGISAEVSDDKMVRSFFRDILVAASSSLRLFGHAYVCCDWRSWASWWEVARGSHLQPKNMIVWDKGGSGLGGMFANTHELMFFASRQPSKQGTMTSGKKAGERMVQDANLWRVDRVSGTRLHNAQKPVELIQRALKNSSDEGGLVLDLFAGSGSTLIACHSMRRVGRMMEIDCKWADVTLRRWQEKAGELPVLQATSEEHDFTAAPSAAARS